MSQIKCQYEKHNEQQCHFICIDTKCKQKRVACFQCFQDQNYHLNHQGLIIEEFQQKVNFRLQNLNQLQTILKEFEEKQKKFIQSQIQFVNNQIIEGNKYLKTEDLNKVTIISAYYSYESDYQAPFAKYQLEKILKKIDKITQYIDTIQYKDIKSIAKEINDIKAEAMNMITNNIGSYEDAIKQLNKGLKKDPVNCSLISLKCTCLIKINQIEKAKKLINYAFQINQNDETVLLFQAKLMMKDKQYEKCLYYCELSTEANQYLAFFKLDSLKQLNQNQNFQFFKNECQKLFGDNFHKEYENHQKMQVYD